jgi:hypothetical protein
MFKNSYLTAGLFFTLALCSNAGSLSVEDASLQSIRNQAPFTFLPEMHAGADISRFLFPKNPAYEKKYFLESDIFLEPVWLSYKEFFYLITSFESNLSMGQKRFVNVLFDPAEINWAITTTFEFRPRFCILQFGEDHRCFHEIDRKDYPTVYWNMLYFAAGSDIMRNSEYSRSVISRGEWSFASRFSWYVRWGVFLKGLFGLVRENNVDYENDRVHEANARLKYSVFSWRNMVFSARSSATAGWWDEPEIYGDHDRIYWRLSNGFEASIHRGKSSFSIFADFYLDDIPEYPDRMRFGRDRLVETGIGFSM